MAEVGVLVEGSGGGGVVWRRKGGWGGSVANVCTAIEQLCICIMVERDYTEG